MEKDGHSSAMSEGEVLDEEDDDGDDDEEGGAETEEQSGNESEMNEQEEDVSSYRVPSSSSCDGPMSAPVSLLLTECFGTLTHHRKGRRMRKRTGRKRKRRTPTT